MEIQEPCRGRVLGLKFHAVYGVKGVWSLLTELI